MALDYTLYFGHAEGLGALGQEVAGRVGVLGSDGVGQARDVALDGLWLALRRTSELSAEIVLEEHGVVCDAYASLRLDKFRLDAAYDSLARVAVALLSSTSGDAVLLFNGELPVLWRRGGLVRLKEGYGVWSEARRAWFCERLAVGGDFEPVELGQDT